MYVVKTHIESVHNGNWHHCDQCEYKAAYKSAVETHIESVHKKELKKRNESVHDGKQHYCNCDKCEYEAAQKCAVKTHIESVHNGQTLSCL